MSWFISCNQSLQNIERINNLPDIYPDYTEVTIPASIAPLNFTVNDTIEQIRALIEAEGDQIYVQGKKHLRIPEKKWHRLLSNHKGKTLAVTVTIKKNGRWKAYLPFRIHVSEYPIDYGIVYRRIAPGYEAYSKMGIYQRSLSDFKETALIENTLIPGSCVNCHSFKQTNTDNMSLHIRGKHGGTLLKYPNSTEIISLKTDYTISEGVYPYWHPSGKYIAYSVNHTQQAFHTLPGERVEVFDHASDIIVYDIENNKILSTPLLNTEDFETFPAFSPEGNSLYFCLSSNYKMPDEYMKVRYNLCRIDFDPQTGTFGNHIDTLIYADNIQKSVSFPRPSYDGKYILYGLADYGNFFIWHKEADLWLFDRKTGSQRSINEVNSEESESFHSWSSNSRWFVFASRRQDGLYSRLYIASIDNNGKITKPFLLPQRYPEKYDNSFYSFNVPEFISNPVNIDINEVEKKIKNNDKKYAK